MRRILLVIALLGLGLGGLIACGGKKPAEAAHPAGGPKPAELLAVRAGKATEVTADETLAATGSIFAGTDVSIAAKIPGRVTYLGTDEGRKVGSGQVLLRLDSRAAEADLHRAQGSLASARAQLAKARLSQSVVEVETQAAVRSAEAQLTASRARLQQAVENEKIARTKSGDKGVDIAQAEANVTNSRSKLEQAKQGLGITARKVVSDVESAEAAVAQAEAGQRSAQAALSQTETSKQLTDSTTQTSVENSRQAVVTAQNHLQILETGARGQEKTQAQSQVNAAQAGQLTAKVEFDRAKFLFDSGAVSKAQLDTAKLLYDTRSEQLRQAQQALSLVQEGPRTEEVNIARAQLAQAQDAAKQSLETRSRELDLRGEDVNRARQELERTNQGIKSATAALATARAARAQQAISESDVAMAEQAVAQAEQALRLAQAGKGQAEIARQEVAAASTQVETAEQNLRRARSNMVQPSINRQDILNLEGMARSAMAAVEAARVHLSDHTIVSPLDASVADKSVEVGEVVSPGQKLLRVVSDRFVHFQALVPEEKVRFVSIGSTVDVKVDAVPNTPFAGRVLEIFPAADMRSRTFTVKIGVENTLRRLREGMFARGLIVTQRNKVSLRVPTEALVKRGDKSYVVRLQGDMATPAEVELGQPHDGTVEITGGDLASGDAVVIDGAEQIEAAQKVKLTQAEK